MECIFWNKHILSYLILTFFYKKQYKHVLDCINPAPIPKSEEKMIINFNKFFLKGEEKMIIIKTKKEKWVKPSETDL